MSEKNSQPYYQVAVNKQMGGKSDSMVPSEFTTAASAPAPAPAKVEVPTGTEMGLEPVFDLNELPVSAEDEEEAPAAEVVVAVAVENAGGSASSGKRKIPEGESGFKQQVKRVKNFVGKWLFKKEFPGDQE